MVLFLIKYLGTFVFDNIWLEITIVKMAIKRQIWQLWIAVSYCNLILLGTFVFDSICLEIRSGIVNMAFLELKIVKMAIKRQIWQLCIAARNCNLIIFKTIPWYFS